MAENAIIHSVEPELNPLFQLEQRTEQCSCGLFVEIDQDYLLLRVGHGVLPSLWHFRVAPGAVLLKLWRVRIQQDLQCVGYLGFDAQVDLDKQKIDKTVSQGRLLLTDLTINSVPNHLGVVVDHRDQDVSSPDSHGHIGTP